jgi:hypothetical protein
LSIRYTVKNTFCILFTLLTLHSFSQGRVDGFYKGKGNTDIVLGGGAEFSSIYFAGRDKLNLARTIYNANIFVAIGLFDNLDVYLAAPYVVINSEQSVQDGSVFLKLKAWNKAFDKGNLTISLAAGVSSNLADYQTEGASAIGQEAKVIDIRPVVHYFSKNGWFCTTQAAYNYKSDPTPAAFAASLKVGKATGKHYFDFWYDHQTSFGGLDYRGTPRPSTFRELGVDFHKVGATYYRPLFDRLGFFLGTSYVVTGRNVSQGIGVNLGFVLKSN